MGKPLKYDSAMRDKWVEMRLDGCTINEIAAETNANVCTISNYFQTIGITRKGRYHQDGQFDPPEETLIWVDGYQLTLDAAMRFLRLKAALGIAGRHWEVEDEQQGIERELATGRFL